MTDREWLALAYIGPPAFRANWTTHHLMQLAATPYYDIYEEVGLTPWSPWKATEREHQRYQDFRRGE